MKAMYELVCSPEKFTMKQCSYMFEQVRRYHDGGCRQNLKAHHHHKRRKGKGVPTLRGMVTKAGRAGTILSHMTPLSLSLSPTKIMSPVKNRNTAGDAANALAAARAKSSD